MQSGLKRQSIDTTQSTNGVGEKEVRFSGRFFTIHQIPPGIEATIAFNSPDGHRHPVTRPRAWQFSEDKTWTVWLFWTLLEPVSKTPLRKTIELEISSDVCSIPTPERIEVIPCPAHTFVQGQKKIAVTGTGVAISTDASPVDEVMITAGVDNVGTLIVGLNGVAPANLIDGTGDGDLLPPGTAKTYPCHRVDQIFINGTAPDKVSYVAPKSRR